MTNNIDHCFSEVAQCLIRQSDNTPTVGISRIGRHTAYNHRYNKCNKQLEHSMLLTRLFIVKHVKRTIPYRIYSRRSEDVGRVAQ